MADTTNIDRLGQAAQGMANSLTSVHNSASQASLSLGRVLTGMLSANVASKTLSLIWEASPFGRAFERLASGLRYSAGEIKALQELAKNSLAEITTRTGKIRKGHEEEAAGLKAQLGLYTDQLRINEKFAKVGNIRISIMLAELSALKQLHAYNSKLQQDLIEANSSFGHRYDLMYDTLNLVAGTGVEFEAATEAARSLVHYGMDNEKSWERNLRFVAQMKTAIGLSTDLGARLAVIFERQLGGSVERMANTMATIVNETALAADEAGRMAEHIMSAVGALREGIGGKVDEVVGVVAKYESAIKGLGGASGELTQALTKYTTIEGMPGAGMLGIGSPEFLADAGQTEAAIERMGAMANQWTKNVGGWQRQAQLEGLSQVLNLSAKTLNILGKVVEDNNRKQLEGITIQERFNQQTVALGAGWKRLGNELWAIAQRVLYPVIAGLNWLVGQFADGLAYLNRNKDVLFTVTVAVGVVMAVTTASILTRLVPALYDLALTASLTSGAAVRATLAMRSLWATLNAPITLAGIRAGLAGIRAGGAGLVAGAGGWGAIAAVAAPLAAIVTLLGLMYWYGRKMSEAIDLQNQTEKQNRSVQIRLRQTQDVLLARALAKADVTETTRVINSMVDSRLKANPMITYEAAHAAVMREVQPMVDQTSYMKALAGISYAEGPPKEALAFDKFSDTLKDVGAQQVRENKDTRNWAKVTQARESSERRLANEAMTVPNILLNAATFWPAASFVPFPSVR